MSASAASLTPWPVPSEPVTLICPVISAASLYAGRPWLASVGSARCSGFQITSRPLSILAVSSTVWHVATGCTASMERSGSSLYRKPGIAARTIPALTRYAHGRDEVRLCHRAFAAGGFGCEQARTAAFHGQVRRRGRSLFRRLRACVPDDDRSAWARRRRQPRVALLPRLRTWPPASWACSTESCALALVGGSPGTAGMCRFQRIASGLAPRPGRPARTGARPGSGRPWPWRLPRWPGAAPAAL